MTSLEHLENWYRRELPALQQSLARGDMDISTLADTLHGALLAIAAFLAEIDRLRAEKRA